jgi:hypothetical protein
MFEVVNHLADYDLSTVRDRPLDYAVHADDRHLRKVDHRGGYDAANRPETGNREGGTAQLIAGGRSLSRGGCQPGVAGAGT